MKRTGFLVTMLAAALLCAPAFAQDAGSDAAVAARAATLDVAGAFSNDGFKLRDGYWVGVVEKDKPLLVGVSLYGGNSYWFSAASATKEAKIAVEILDEDGKLVETDPYNDGPRCAAGISAPHSGLYQVRIRVIEGDHPSVALVYSYK
jgi:ABC-type sugar transport system substrate-binding protein